MARYPFGVELYRLYNADDCLLYVGVSTNLVERLRSHAHRPPAGKPWFGDVAYCSLENFREEWQALEAERAAIRSERPLYNIRSVARGA